MADQRPVAALVLTGGESRRMGRDKSTLLVAGERLARRVRRQAEAAVDGPVLEVGPGTSDGPHVADREPALGPLAAIAAGATALRERYGHDGAALVLACDLPNLTVELLRFLAGREGTVVPVVAGRAQPLCARWGEGALAAAVGAVADGRRTVLAALDEVDVVWIDEQDWGAVAAAVAFADVDTPEDLEAIDREPR